VKPDLLTFLLKPGIEPSQVEGNIWSVLPPDERTAPYDRMARAYDWLIGNGLYNKLVWGNWSALYRSAAARAVQTLGEGPILDCGCGSLIFTAHAYRAAPLDRMILFDRSIGMMQRGSRRLPDATFIQGDALNLPFVDESFATCFSWGLAHIFGSTAPLFAELCRVTRRGGCVSLSMLVLADRNPGDRVLPQLYKRGEIASPEYAQAMKVAFAKCFTLESAEVCGNMLFLSGRRPL
jgi:ubiquinone/menaquinone biosynthesis C-methylase UbiE